MKKTLLYSAMMLSGLALTACSDDNYGDPAVDLQGTTHFIVSPEENGFQTFYKPQLGTVGDPMPFFDPKAGDFKVMYLQEFPDVMKAPGRYHPYWAVSTKDGASYQSEGEWLSIGEFDTQQDAILGTGCCTYDAKSGLYYIYYTGESEKTANRQVVMRATSSDLKTWTRDNLWRLQGPDFGLSGNDFRDPQIFMVDNQYHMIVSTKPVSGGDPCFAEFVSDDLKAWKHLGNIKMIWDRMLECPDVFQMGNYWYIVYSETPAWSRRVKYNMASSWEELRDKMNNGPSFVDFQEGSLDTRALYAGKTASNGTERYLWGWCSWNVMLGSDSAEPEWSGALVCHKVAQHEDGSLYLTAVPAMASKYNKPVQVKVMKSGETKDENGNVCESYILYNRLGAHNHITLTVKTQNPDDKFGLTFGRGTETLVYWDKIWFNNPHWDNDKKQQRRIERYLTNGVVNQFMPGGVGNFYSVPENNTFNIDIYTDNNVLVMYVNGTNCYTTRVSSIANNCWGISTEPDVKVEVSNVNVSQY